jgi:hypothetical protein
MRPQRTAVAGANAVTKDIRDGGVRPRRVGEERLELEAQRTSGKPPVLPERSSAAIPELDAGDRPVR